MNGTEELIKSYMGKHPAMSRQAATDEVKFFIESFVEMLRNTTTESPCTISRLGSFKRVARKERSARNPRTGEPVTIAAREVVRFYPSSVSGING